MHHNRILPIILVLFSFNSCIENYRPDIGQEESELYVVEGKVTNIQGFQSIYVSRSSAVENPRRIPVEYCTVRIFDNKGNAFLAEEFNPGEYKVEIPEEYLLPGTAFNVEVYTPEGNMLQSDFDTLRPCPDLDSIYYSIENFVMEEAGVYTPGIQFYMDYDGRGSPAKRIMIEFEETWRYQASYPAKWIWDGRRLTTLDPPDFSRQICWKTQKNDRSYLFRTDNQSVNVYNQFPLHHILNTSMKLLQGYSLLVRQLSVSEDAWFYYQKINANIVESGGLYETQPQQLNGNIHNVTDPGNRVLGYFLVAGASEKRIFISSVEGLPLDPGSICSPTRLDLGYGILRNLTQPVYLWFENGTYLLNDACVDCTAFGGTTEKPGFWPE